MISVAQALAKNATARILAQAVLSEYFNGKQVEYPINPFQMLTDFGVPFVFRPFSKALEGVFFPAQDENDLPVVGINLKRPIQRQRYTAAHELCHYIKDNKTTSVCDTTSTSSVEKYAENFAAELLMPFNEMKKQICLRKPTGYLSFDDVLEIAEYFGVSFKSCLYRAAWTYKKIDGDTHVDALSRRADKYHSDKQRERRGYTNLLLYEQLIDAAKDNLSPSVPREHIAAKYCNNYVYNDSRLEGISLDSSKVAEIVADIRLHGSDSQYCNESHENEVAIAGHANMYEYMLSAEKFDKIDIFALVHLHKRLYSCAPDPDFGGSIRTQNVLVLGAKFETVDYKQIMLELLKVNDTLTESLNNCVDMPLSKYVEAAARIHHRLTVIHPFGDGNGRVTRAFLNLLLLYRGMPPVYIRVEDKEEYRAALEEADLHDNYSPLYIVVFKALLRAQVEFTEALPN